jgi:hypothetical protein
MKRKRKQEKTKVDKSDKRVRQEGELQKRTLHENKIDNSHV